MSNLTGTQISNTYKGLLKLDDATTGITSSFQAVQDGLGNNTGTQIKDGFLWTPNTFQMYKPHGFTTPDFMGTGVNTSAQNINGIYNRLLAFPFFDPGTFTYSGMSYYCQAASATDTIELAFYNAQWVDGIGLQPYELVLSGISLDNSTTGNKSVNFPSNLTFGNGPGIYFGVMKITNAGVSPTARLGRGYSLPTFGGLYANQFFGYIPWTSGGSDLYALPYKSSSGTNTGIVMDATVNYKTTFSVVDVSNPATSLSAPELGMALKVVK